jgi:methoxymalonate biosynthesis acyl carrier protein
MTAIDSAADKEVRETIRRFVARSTNIPDLGDDDDLFESGLVNSLFAIQLMTFIEKTFAIEVEADDLDINNFKSLNAAMEFVLRKSAAKVA